MYMQMGRRSHGRTKGKWLERKQGGDAPSHRLHYARIAPETRNMTHIAGVPGPRRVRLGFSRANQKHAGLGYLGLEWQKCRQGCQILG